MRRPLRSSRRRRKRQSLFGGYPPARYDRGKRNESGHGAILHMPLRLHQLPAEADELETLFVAHRLQPIDLSAGVRLPRRASEFDADALLRMVDDLEYNMRLSTAESDRGRLYDRYMEKRGTRLRGRWGSEGHPLRTSEVKRMEEAFGEIWAHMKEQFGCRDQDRQKLASADHTMTGYEEQVGSYQTEVFGGDQVNYGHGTRLDDASPNYGSYKGSEKVLYCRSSSFNKVSSIPRPSTRPPTFSSSPKSRDESRRCVSKSGPLFGDVRKESMKPLTRTGKVNNPLSARSVVGSKTYAKGPKDFEQEKVLTPRHRRIWSLDSNELDGMTFMKSDNPSPALSKLSKEIEMSEKTMPHDDLNREQMKPLLGRDSGTALNIGAGASMAIAKVVEASEIGNKEKESGEFRNHQSRSSELEGEESRLILESMTGRSVELQNDFNLIRSSDTQAGTYSSYVASQIHAALDAAEGSIQKNQRTSNLSQCPLQSGVLDIDEPVLDTELGARPTTWNRTHPLCLMREAEATRLRKKWGSAETPPAANSSTRAQKNVVKAFKMLLKLGKKNKIAESATDFITCGGKQLSKEDLEEARVQFRQI